jgi:type IV pilus assembly protein PilZ
VINWVTVREARSYPRVPVHFQVRYRSGAELASSFIDSLSGGGVFIRTTRPMPIGTELVMEITLDDQGPEPILVRGRVVWERLLNRQDGGMGVQFLEPPSERLKKILISRVA